MSAARARCAAGVSGARSGGDYPPSPGPAASFAPSSARPPLSQPAPLPRRRRGRREPGVESRVGRDAAPDFWMGHLRAAPDLRRDLRHTGGHGGPEGQNSAHPAGLNTRRASTGSPRTQVVHTCVPGWGGAGNRASLPPPFQSGVAGSLQVSSMSVWDCKDATQPGSRGFPMTSLSSLLRPHHPGSGLWRLATSPGNDSRHIVLVGQAGTSRRRP